MHYTLFANAVVFAAREHHGQTRNEASGEVDYVIHPIRVAEHLRRLADVQDVELLCAAVLHDTIEDSGTRYDEIVEAFGERVARIVAELSNDCRLPKHERHEDMIRRLVTASNDAKVIKLADRLDNLTHIHLWNAERRLRFIAETHRLLDEALGGICPPLEHAIRQRLSEPD